MKFGIIGLGDMGKALARTFALKGIEVVASDLPENTEELKNTFSSTTIEILDRSSEVASNCDILLFSVESNSIEKVVKEVAPHISSKTIVGAQTSVKTPEIRAFESYLSKDVPIVTIHSLHGPHVDPAGQTMIIINHRASEECFQKAYTFYALSGSRMEVLPSYEEHDKMMADVQVVTHIGFESIGTSFMHRGLFPWENPAQVNGLDNLKLLLTLRIFSYKHHVYAGMAMLNPFAQKDVRTYAKAENDLFAMMISGDYDSLVSTIKEAGDAIFGQINTPLMLNDELMAEYALFPSENQKPNSHLSLMSMVLTWFRLGSNPYQNLVCQTPPFKLRVGMAEYLFRNPSMLKQSLETAISDLSIRKDDLAFHTAVQEWAHIVESKNLEAYENHFIKTKYFLKDRLAEGRRISGLLIDKINTYEQS